MEYKVNSGNVDALIGTSRQGYLDAGYAELAGTLGDPLAADDYDGKTDAVWLIEFEDGTVASVYNYKDDRTNSATKACLRKRFGSCISAARANEPLNSCSGSWESTWLVARTPDIAASLPLTFDVTPVSPSHLGVRRSSA